jgi:hypothetical protein
MMMAAGRFQMDRQKKIESLMAREAEDRRRLALDELDAEARRTNTFGSAAHRSARDRVEAGYDSTRVGFERLSEAELDQALATT